MAVERFLLCAHHRDAFGCRARQEAVDALVERHRLRKPVVLDLTVDVTGTVVRPSPQLLTEEDVLHPVFRKRALERVTVELRSEPASRNRTNVSDCGYTMLGEKREEVVDCMGRVTDGEDHSHLRSLQPLAPG